MKRLPVKIKFCDTEVTLNEVTFDIAIDYKKTYFEEMTMVEFKQFVKEHLTLMIMDYFDERIVKNN